VLAKTIAPAFAAAGAPLIMLDYDGSLREFTDRHEDAVPTGEIKDILCELGGLDDVMLYIVSGRDKDTLGDWFADMPVNLIAEHGAWMRKACRSEWRQMGQTVDATWKAETRPVLDEYVERTPGAQVEEKTGSLVWHYRQADPDIAEWQALELAAVLENMLANAPVEILMGAKIVEIRQQGLDKGWAYEYVKEQQGPFDFVLATGDDRTDEDLFARLDPDAFTVHIGGGGSRANASVGSPASVRRLLKALCEARRNRLRV
jgi:trehalose 6-phosphate synthase/phosphatase